MYIIFHLFFLYFHLSLFSLSGCSSCYIDATCPCSLLSCEDRILVVIKSIFLPQQSIGLDSKRVAQFSSCKDKFNLHSLSFEALICTCPSHGPGEGLPRVFTVAYVFVQFAWVWYFDDNRLRLIITFYFHLSYEGDPPKNRMTFRRVGPL